MGSLHSGAGLLGILSIVAPLVLSSCQGPGLLGSGGAAAQGYRGRWFSVLLWISSSESVWPGIRCEKQTGLALFPPPLPTPAWPGSAGQFQGPEGSRFEQGVPCGPGGRTFSRRRGSKGRRSEQPGKLGTEAQKGSCAAEPRRSWLVGTTLILDHDRRRADEATCALQGEDAPLRTFPL